ncbi:MULTISPECIES: MFS transporter [Bacillus]|uniref:MFS transporter n=1 Tax=Bacillus TaxID=1386 RepID=UPI00032FCFB8|nr:MFS transporter [Bacillus wiedmannii]EOP09089.1 tetracycline resistance determinant tetV [Bacillus cereus BAG2O-3]EOQ13675.1 tetracycline resistance determinant tetV [Bacillus cereus B5-2]MBJ8115067.1 MFS transporter [Bacillus cereus]PFW86377.1 MFS transporter [Bacillus sp. AFS075960]RFB14021.1 MFS transporter [Bacillus sp. OE]RFB27157.1 MFS transporter [Bacillus sp. LB(2018)]RFB48052.1 MFS transporter [Bacillus sp. dmp10]RFB70147.1 MFS transporter [Bacillus sp. AW]HDR8172846.1 MFS tran
MQGEVQREKALGYVGKLLLPVKASRHFKFLWIGQLLSTLGSSITMVILPVVVYSLTGSTVVMGMTMAMYMLPNILALPFAGLVVDRIDRVKLMLFTDIIRCILMLLLATLIFMDVLTIPFLYVLVALYGLMEGIFQPAYSAVRAKVFVPEIRNAANALTQMSNQGIRLIGPALGGLIVSVASAGIGFGLDAVTYLLSFFCLLFLREIKFKKVRPIEKSKVNYKQEFMEGVFVLKSHPWLWVTILVFSFINICYAGIIVVLIPWLFNVHHHFEAYVYGLGMASSGVGAVIAALIFGGRERWHKRGLLAYGGVLISGCALLIMPFIAWAPALIGLMAIEGFGMMIFGLIWETSLQELVPEEAFGRVASLDMLGSFALLPLGYVVVGWLATVIGGEITIITLAILVLVTIGIALSVPSIRRFD